MDSLGDAWGFSSKTPITPSRNFSVETLTEVTLSWKTKLNRSTSTMEDGIPGLSRSLTVDFIFIFFFHFSLFFFLFHFYFLFLEQIGLEWIGHAVTSVTNWWHHHKTNYGTWEGSRRFWNEVTSYSMDNTCWPHVIHMVIRVGCTVVSTDHK